MEIAKAQPLWAVLAGVLGILAIVSQLIPRARIAMRVALFFGAMAGFGYFQGWHRVLATDGAQSVEMFRSFAWIADVGLAALFLAMATILTFGRGRGGLISLGCTMPILIAGAGSYLGWWGNPVLWSNAPVPALTEAGTLLLGLGGFGILASLGCLALQKFAPDPVRYLQPARQMPHAFFPEEEHGHPAEPEDDMDLPGEAEPSDHPWTPMRKHAIRRHRHRRSSRSGH